MQQKERRLHDKDLQAMFLFHNYFTTTLVQVYIVREE